MTVSYPVMGQNQESCHNITIRGTRSNLLELSSCVDGMKMIHCPACKDILWKQDGQIFSESTVAAKKANHLLPRTDTQMTIDKWARRWTNLHSYKYSELVPAMCKKSLRYKWFQLKNTARKRII